MILRPALNRTWLAILLVVSAAVFTVGVAVERSTVHIDSHAAVSSTEGSSQHVEGSGAKENGSSSETIFGLNPESTGLVVTAVTVSVALALAVWFWDMSAVLLLVLLFGLGAAIFDAREVVFQEQASRGTIAALAALTALLHIGVLVVAWRVWQRSSQETAPALHRA